jgi:hypothetical protein
MAPSNLLLALLCIFSSVTCRTCRGCRSSWQHSTCSFLPCTATRLLFHAYVPHCVAPQDKRSSSHRTTQLCAASQGSAGACRLVLCSVACVVFVCWLRLDFVPLSCSRCFKFLELAFHPYNSSCLLSAPLSIVTAACRLAAQLHLSMARHSVNYPCAETAKTFATFEGQGQGRDAMLLRTEGSNAQRGHPLV